MGDKRFAVTAPWSVELQKNIFVVVHDNRVVVVSHNEMHRPILLLRDSLGLDAWLNLAVNEVLNKLADIFRGELLALVEGELLVLDCFLDGEGGPLVDLKIQIAGMSAKCLCVDGREADGSLVLLCEGLEGLGEFGALFGGLGEDVRKRNTSLWRRTLALPLYIKCLYGHSPPYNQRMSPVLLHRPGVRMPPSRNSQLRSCRTSPRKCSCPHRRPCTGRSMVA